MKAKWKDIPGYEGLYAVSRDGRVWTYRSKRYIKLGRFRYQKVVLYKNGKGVFKSTHRLVAEAFIPNPKGLPEVNHKNGNGSDNRVENLEWISHRDNIQHSVDVLGKLRRFTDAQIEVMHCLRKDGLNYSEIGLAYDCDHSVVRDNLLAHFKGRVIHKN